MQHTENDDPSPTLGDGPAKQQIAGEAPPSPPSTRAADAAPRSRAGQQPLRLAVLGATGLVGQEMIRLLEASEIPISELRLLASSRSESLSLTFRGQLIPVQAATHELLSNLDVVLASAGGSVSKKFLPGAAKDGAVCIDNTSAFRMDEGVPLVVPEVNGHELLGIKIGGEGAIIANPNCSTIQLVAALKPLHDLAGLRRVIVSTYQSVSGAGQSAIRKFESASRALLAGHEDLEPALQGTAAFDLVPVIGDLDSDGHSSEELKMVHETSKILGNHIDLDVSCVRVPVITGHAEAVLAEFHEPLSPEQATRELGASPTVIVQSGVEFPTPRTIAGQHSTYVGRIRTARTLPNALQMWVVADNLLKGAALNAVQILKGLISQPPPPKQQGISIGAAPDLLVHAIRRSAPSSPSKFQTQSRIQS